MKREERRKRERNGDEMAEAIEREAESQAGLVVVGPRTPPIRVRVPPTPRTHWTRGTTFLNGEARLEMIDGRSNHHGR